MHIDLVDGARESSKRVAAKRAAAGIIQLPCDICGHDGWSRCEDCNGIICDVNSGGCGRGRHHPWGPFHGLPCSCPRGPGPPDPAPPVARRA